MNIRKAIGAGNDLYIVTDGEGLLWATNRYWLVPADRVAPLLEANGLELVTGQYDVGSFGKPATRTGDAPSSIKPDRILKADYDSILAPAMRGGEQILFRKDQGFFALYESDEDVETRINLNYLDWVTWNDENPRVRLNEKGTVVKIVNDNDEVDGFIATTRKR